MNGQVEVNKNSSDSAYCSLFSYYTIGIKALFYGVDFIAEGGRGFEETPYEKEMLSYAKPIAMVSVALGFLVAGIFITLYKSWARVLAQVFAVLYLINLWYQVIFIALYNPFDNGVFGIEQVLELYFGLFQSSWLFGIWAKKRWRTNLLN